MFSIKGRKLIGVIVSLLILIILWKRSRNMDTASMEYEIKTTWDNQQIDKKSVKLFLSTTDVGLVLDVSAPFFNDPQDPGGPRGQPFQKLWEFEVVEAFFLNDKDQYLEVELCPHGQHIVLMLNGIRKVLKDLLPITYQASIVDKMWSGRAVIPWIYFPPLVNKFNAYAVHGSGTARVYWALYPVPTGTYDTPDFHRLKYFQNVDFSRIWSKTDSFQNEPSPYWTLSSSV